MIEERADGRAIRFIAGMVTVETCFTDANREDLEFSTGLTFVEVIREAAISDPVIRERIINDVMKQVADLDSKIQEMAKR